MWMKLEDIVQNKRRQSLKDDAGWFHSCEVSRVVTLIETEGRRMVGLGSGEVTLGRGVGSCF
jgi:hypothetical protein